MTRSRSLYIRLAVLFIVCFASVPAFAIIDVNLQMQLGNPSGAIVDTNNHDHYLLQRTVDSLDFSDNLGGPTWAAWDLTSADFGTATRNSSFYVDTNLPSNFYRVSTTDYNNSGYDRGHQCPSADRTDTTADNKLVFFMSNITPQQADLNQGPWESLEGYCRDLANQGNELLIQCGPELFDGTRIQPSGKAAIGTYNWKIITVVASGAGSALSRVTTNSRVITAKMPNTTGIRFTPWANYLTNAAQIQSDTGYTFFSALDTNTAAILRAKVDSGAGSQSPATHVTISQIYGGGGNSGAPYLNKFVELFNPGTNIVDLSTYAIQYASAGGSTWTAGNLNGSIWPGDYYLIQMSSGGTNGVALPQASCTNSINPAATAGKFALTKTQTALSGSNPLSNSNIVDFVGYGTTASAYEGSGPAPAPSNTKSDFRNGDGMYDSDTNSLDFYTAPPDPRSSYVPAPGITSFSPSSGGAGASVTITGTSFNTAEYVKFNGTASTFSVDSDTQITATVPSGASSGTIVVTTHGGTATSASSFTFIPAPSISSFSPGSGGPGTSVTITGANFTGATAVSFNGTAASSYSVDSSTQITATVPSGSTTGPISVTTGGGTATSASNFTPIPAPSITSFTPGSGGLNVSVTLTGTAFTGATSVKFNGTSASFTVNSDTQITTSVPSGATSGTISVTTASGTGTSSTSFTCSGHVTISQVYGGGGNSGATYLNDFIELYNESTVTVDLGTWAVQYASAAGSSWSVTALSGTIAPGAHYLIKEASGGSKGSALPTPQVTGTINLSATAGKVALTSNTTALSGTNPLPNANIVDFVGFGSTASAYEGSGPAPAPSNTTSDLRANAGATDTDSNSADFSTGTPNPRNS